MKGRFPAAHLATEAIETQDRHAFGHVECERGAGPGPADGAGIEMVGRVELHEARCGLAQGSGDAGAPRRAAIGCRSCRQRRELRSQGDDLPGQALRPGLCQRAASSGIVGMPSTLTAAGAAAVSTRESNLPVVSPRSLLIASAETEATPCHRHHGSTSSACKAAPLPPGSATLPAFPPQPPAPP